MAIVKEGWEKPKPPTCSVCGIPIDLVAVNGGDGWGLMWDENCPNDHVFVEADEEYYRLVGEAAWPFVEDSAKPSDWEKLGIRTE